MLGDEIKYYCVKKWGSQKKAAKILEVSPNVLSLVINNHRKPTAELITKLTAHGFDEDHFKKYFLDEKDNLDALTKKEVIELVRQQKNLLDQQKELINFLSKRIDKLVKN